MGDGAEVFNQFVLGHPNTEILDGQLVRCVVRGNVDFEIELFLEDVFLGKLQATQLFQGIGCVGDQFADEDFLVLVKRVHDDIEYLFGLRLKLVGACLFAHVIEKSLLF